MADAPMYRPIRFITSADAQAWLQRMEDEDPRPFTLSGMDMQTRRLHNTAFHLFPRFGPRHVMITAPSELSEQVARHHLAGEQLLAPTQGSMSCWLDVPLVTMRFLGIGRMEGDRMSEQALQGLDKSTSTAIELLDIHWPTLQSPELGKSFDDARTALQRTIATDMGDPGLKDFHSPGNCFATVATGLPSVSFHQATRLRCTACGNSRTKGDPGRVVTTVETSLLPEERRTSPGGMMERTVGIQSVLDRIFGWEDTKMQCDECKDKNTTLQRRRVVIDRAPHILTLGSSFTTLPGSPGADFLDPLRLRYMTVTGATLAAEYRPVAFFHSSMVHITLTVLVEKKDGGQPEWLGYDGYTGIRPLGQKVSMTDRLQTLGVSTAFYMRVYTGMTEGKGDPTFTTEADEGLT